MELGWCGGSHRRPSLELLDMIVVLLRSSLVLTFCYEFLEIVRVVFRSWLLRER